MKSKTRTSTLPTILSCRRLRKSFNQIEVIKDVAFSVRQGEKIGIVGSNGSGKSTLLKILFGLMEADSGVIDYGKNIIPVYLPQAYQEQNLSGGELAKKTLQSIIGSGANLFLLDEPTNNLDDNGLRMMEKFVKQNKSAFIIVSHDRMFLDRTVTKIIELDSHLKTALIYNGNYSFYEKEKLVRIEKMWQKYADSQEKTKRLSFEMEKRLSWMKKIEKARRTIKNLPVHEREKPVAAELRDREGRAGKRAKIIKARLESHKSERLEEKPVYELPLRVMFNPDRGGVKVFNLNGVKKQIGSKTIGPLTISIQYGDRVHITGDNGAGKTTLLKIILGLALPDCGNVEKGESVKVGYIQQLRSGDLENDIALKHFLKNTNLDQTNARRVLNRFRITAGSVKKKISELSPGEYSRLIIAEIFATQPNCIIVDEPSNHLDVEALKELESGLANFSGTLIVVSHDRYFVKKLNLTKEIHLPVYSE